MNRSINIDYQFDPEEERYIEHCIFSWSVDNLVRNEKKNYEYARSPKFSLRSSFFSTWCVKFKCGILLNGHQGIELLLHRFSSDYGANKASVTFRFGLMNSAGNKVWFQEMQEKIFGNPDTFSTSSSILGQLEDFYDGTLIVFCELYASATKKVELMNIHPGDYLLTYFPELSKDLIKLYVRHPLSNVLLRVSSDEFRVHKSVLTARSPFFTRLLADGNSYIELPAISGSVMSFLLSFVYSGNLSFTLEKNNMVIGLYEAAYDLSLFRLSMQLAPTLITAKTSLDVEESSFTWSIENFSLRRFSDNVIVSPEFSGILSIASGWRVSLYDQQASEYFEVSIKPRAQKGNLAYSLKISLLDKDGKPWTTKCQTGLIAPGENCCFPLFVQKSELFRNEEFLLPSNTLTLECKLRFPTGGSPMISSSSAHTSFGEISNLEDLSKNLSSIYTSGHLSDITLSAGDVTFNLHKDILAARTEGFATRIEYLSTYEIPNLNPDVLKTVLTYLYTGILKVHNPQAAMELYKATRVFGMSFIKQECIRYLERSLSIPIVLDVYRFARYFFEKELKGKCLNYMCSNSDELFQHKEWRNLESNSHSLAMQIFNEMEDNF